MPIVRAMEFKKRHIAKTISYRVTSSFVSFFVLLILTGSLEFSTTYSFLEFFWKPLQYYFHERLWYRWIDFGKSSSYDKYT